MRREERVTVQGPVKEQQPGGMSHKGAYRLEPPPPRPWPCVAFPHQWWLAHPPNSVVLGTILCEALPAPAWEGCQGAEAVLVSRGMYVVVRVFFFLR